MEQSKRKENKNAHISVSSPIRNSAGIEKETGGTETLARNIFHDSPQLIETYTVRRLTDGKHDGVLVRRVTYGMASSLKKKAEGARNLPGVTFEIVKDA